jgi:hypothetical protein
MNFRSDASSGRSLASRFRDLKMIPCSWEIHPSCARHENENICFVKQKNPVSLMSICVLYRRDPYFFVSLIPLFLEARGVEPLFLIAISSNIQERFYPNNIDLAHEELRFSTRKTEKTMARQAPMDSLRPRIPHGQPLVRSNRLDCYTSEGSACSCTGPADC